jgi:hypothetical protein
MELEPVTGRGNEEDAGEKIGIARIRLRLPVCGMTAVVSGFYEADRALTEWKNSSRPVHACEYTIQFTDGNSLRGRFSFARKRPKLPSLWRIIQTALGVTAAAAGLQVDHALVDRHGNTLNTRLLEQYSIEKS